MADILVKMHIDYGRSGDVRGMFFVDEVDFELAKRANPYVEFGEILGKHSEVACNISDMDFEIVPLTQEELDVIQRVFGCGTISGYNPFDRFDVEDLEVEDEDEEE